MSNVPPVHREAGSRITVRIVAPHFCASVDVEQRERSAGVVVEAAPILKYMVGWSAERLRMYADSKGWSMSRVADPTPDEDDAEC